MEYRKRNEGKKYMNFSFDVICLRSHFLHVVHNYKTISHTLEHVKIAHYLAGSAVFKDRCQDLSLIF